MSGGLSCVLIERELCGGGLAELGAAGMLSASWRPGRVAGGGRLRDSWPAWCWELGQPLPPTSLVGLFVPGPCKRHRWPCPLAGPAVAPTCVRACIALASLSQVASM